MFPPQRIGWRAFDCVCYCVVLIRLSIHDRSNRPRSDTGIKECRSTPKGVGRYPPGGTGDASREAVDQMVVPKAA
jgi:hypothetical protein